MKLTLCSDIHCNFDKFPVSSIPEDTEIVLCAGDITNFGHKRPREIEKAVNWIKPIAEKFTFFFIAGNHDIAFKGNEFHTIPEAFYVDHAPNYAGGHIIQGVNMSPCYNSPELALYWDFMTDNEEVEKAAYENLGVCDILISHCPPYGVLDEAYGQKLGSVELLKYIEKYQPKLVVTGHIHESSGRHSYVGKTLVVNTACRFTHVEI